jgi:Ca2+-transporting ATPase
MDGIFKVEGTGFMPRGRVINSSGHPLKHQELEVLRPLIECGYIANNASIHQPDSEHPSWYSVGDPTEAALVTLAQKTLFSGNSKPAQEIKEFPFDSDRKRMSVVAKQGKSRLVFAKGSPEAILQSSTHILQKGKIVRLNAAHRKKIEAFSAEMSSQAMRNLAMAYKPLEANLPNTASQAEHQLIFLGVASMIDPPREEVAEAMAAAQRAHMLVTIITGDEARTAAAIAEQIGFADGKKPILTNHNQFVKLNDKQIEKQILTGRAIFARVSPSDKLRIVNILKNSGHILAVTGDGINDAPALKRADIGVAMGRIGSDVAKDSAEIVLLDDSFHTLVNAIQLGRVIYQNIRKAALSAITSNGGELVVVLLSLAMTGLFHIPIAISALQILAIDLMAELFPIAALGWDPPTGNIMNDKPRNIKQHILDGRAIFDLVAGGIIIGAMAYGSFLITFAIAGAPVAMSNAALVAKATTAAYLTIALCQYVTVLSRRTAPGESMFTSYIFSNWRLWAAIGFSLFCVLLIIYVPFLARYIGNGPLSFTEWLAPIAAAGIYLIIREVVKIKWRLTAS